MGPPGDAGVPAAQEERQAAASSYSQALRDRLHRIRAEMEAQGALALRLRRSLEGARAEVEKNSRELYELRVRWTEEEPSRAELLRETGEVERRLSERERRCAEALVQLAERDQAPGAAEAAPPPAGRAAPTSPHGATAALRGDAYDDDFEQEEDGEEGRRRARLAQERQRLAGLESRRLELVSELGRLRELSAQEAASVEQLSERIEAIRKEARTARTLARASREREERSKQKIEASTATAAASRQRQRALESQVADLGTEIDVLRGELAAVAQPAVGAAASGGPAHERDSRFQTPGCMCD
ncbi:unnamed protein product [Prorocentrum cordatum]|uniref:Uncharacterized protein n=1 Tax=Prorocentrum cordatum TaxID=2364126 RepID=A0ABN9SI10_9DINO|nr:unnamed protein product [Polarella glacialis]